MQIHPSIGLLYRHLPHTQSVLGTGNKWEKGGPHLLGLTFLGEGEYSGESRVNKQEDKNGLSG